MKDRQLMIRMSERLLDEVRRRAKHNHVTVSAYIRMLLIGTDPSLAEDDLTDGRATGKDFGVKQIPLTRGFVALVDEEDFERVNRHKWNMLNHGAAQARIGMNRVQMHRFILGLSADDTRVVDHINHNRLDNRRCNLRIATQSQNAANKASYRSDGKFKGVIDGMRGRQPKIGNVPWGRSQAPQKRFRAIIVCRGVKHDLGGFPTPEAAARAYDAKAREMFGEYALTNFPQAVAA